MKIIFTGQDFSIARKELESVFSCEPAASLDPEVGIIDLPGSIGKIYERFMSTPVLFTRHIFPVHIALPAGANPLEAVGDIAERLDITRSYSVQARAVGGSDATRALSQALREKGFLLDIRAPEQIVSVYSAESGVYIGVSDAKTNLSDWNGGMMHFSSRDLISRAECKLLEALRVFDIPAASGQTALDLGAAPGGWSKALAGLGMQVTAVDPAALDDRAAKLPGVRHEAVSAQEYLHNSNEKIHLIVNDMKMDAREAIELLMRFRDRLHPDGMILSTLKLPKQNAAGVAYECVKSIRKQANLITARQLFHNRSEITVLFS